MADLTDDQLQRIIQIGDCSAIDAVAMATEIVSRRRAERHALHLMETSDNAWGNILDDLTDGSMRRALDREAV